MPRFAVLALACLAATPAFADWDRAALDRAIATIEQRAQGKLGVALLDLKDRATWSHRGAESFPMQSVFKLPLAVAALQAVEAGRLRLDEPVTVTRQDLSLHHSPLARAFSGERNDYAVRDLIGLAAGQSDNTAADVLMRRIGGPQAVTAMLKQGGIAGISVDRYEREFQPQTYGLPAFGWDEVIDETRYRARLRGLGPERRMKALQAYLDTDPRDKATPLASVAFLEALARGNWLREPRHATLLDELIVATPSGRNRIKAGLPAGARLAHKTGSGWSFDGITSALNDIGLVTLPDGRRFAIAVYLTGSRADATAREATHAAVATAAVAALR